MRREEEDDETLFFTMARDPRFALVQLRFDENTGELCARCAACQAEATYSAEYFVNLSSFLHKVWCPSLVPVHEA
jgi:hypothetical protein